MGKDLPDNLLVLLLGSNLGNREALFEEALKRLSVVGSLVRTSGLVESEAWGYDSQNRFLNQVAVFECNLEPSEVLQHTQKIENDAGRKKKPGEDYADRTLDIDLLFYGNRVLKTDQLSIPHPAIPDRRFTLVPLSEVLREYIHPELKVDMSRLLTECKDSSKVRKYGV